MSCNARSYRQNLVHKIDSFPCWILSRSSTIHKIKSNPLANDQSTFPDSKAHNVIAFQRTAWSAIVWAVRRDNRNGMLLAATKLVRLIMCPQLRTSVFWFKSSVVVAASRSMTQRLIYLRSHTMKRPCEERSTKLKMFLWLGFKAGKLLGQSSTRRRWQVPSSLDQSRN